MLDEIAHDPVLSCFADVDGKVLNDLCTARSVLDFGVELDSYKRSELDCRAIATRGKATAQRAPTINGLCLMSNSRIL